MKEIQTMLVCDVVSVVKELVSSNELTTVKIMSVVNPFYVDEQYKYRYIKVYCYKGVNKVAVMHSSIKRFRTTRGANIDNDCSRSKDILETEIRSMGVKVIRLN